MKTAIILVFASSVLIAGTALAQTSGQCQAVQNMLNAGPMGQGTSHIGTLQNRSNYLTILTDAITQLTNAKLITNQCGICISTQLGNKVPADSQAPCGTPPPVWTSLKVCKTPPSDAQMDVLIPMAIAADVGQTGVRDLMTQGQIQYEDSALNCRWELMPGKTTFKATPDLLMESKPASTVNGSAPFCANPVSGVQYCGPGNSATNPNSPLVQITVACLNDACFHHDTDYAQNCIQSSCIWSPQTKSYDDKLLSTCIGQNSNCPITSFDAKSKDVCRAVKCLEKVPPASLLERLECVAAQAAASHNCTGPPPVCQLGELSLATGEDEPFPYEGQPAQVNVYLDSNNQCSSGQPITLTVQGQPPIHTITGVTTNTNHQVSTTLTTGPLPAGGTSYIASMDCSNTQLCNSPYGINGEAVALCGGTMSFKSLNGTTSAPMPPMGTFPTCEQLNNVTYTGTLTGVVGTVTSPPNGTCDFTMTLTCGPSPTIPNFDTFTQGTWSDDCNVSSGMRMPLSTYGTGSEYFPSDGLGTAAFESSDGCHYLRNTSRLLFDGNTIQTS